MKNIVWFKDISEDDIGIVGGKAQNLGIMYNLKLPVPPGFVVTAQAYQSFLEDTGLNKKIYSLLKNLDIQDTDKLEKVAKQVQEAILDKEVPETIANDVKFAYDNISIDLSVFKSASKSALDIIKAGRDIPWVAVRSSATAEDLPSISENEHILVKINNRTYFRPMKNIYSLVGDGSDYEIEIPAMKDNKIQWIKVGSLYKHKIKEGEKLYKITTETGREITIAPNHTLIVLDEDTLTPKNVKSIKFLKGDEKLPAINKLPILDLKQENIDILDYINGEDIIEEDGLLKIKNKSTNWRIQYGLPRKINLTKDFAYFLGVYCAEGCTYKENEIIITNSDNKIMNRVIRFVSSVKLYNNQKINRYSLRFHNKAFTRFLKNTIGDQSKNKKGKGEGCRNKRVPEFVFGWNKELIGEFLRGCFDGDGYCGKNAIEYCSTSKMLTSGIIKLLEMLEIEWYLREKNNAFNIIIHPWSFDNFSKFICFECDCKKDKLNKLIKEFNERKNHPEFLNNIHTSSKLSMFLRNKFEDSIPKDKILANFCPKCQSKINKSSKYLKKERFYCGECHKAFYENDVIKKEIEQYVYYDSKGKFTKNQIPWNKGFLSKKYGFKQFQKLISKNNLQFDSLNDSVKWDQIKEIKEVDCNGYVYDFCIPEVENFAAGIGGIITHNTASFAGQQETFLNIKGGDNIIRALQRCWASLFTARAIYYRTKNNFPHDKVLIAVIIQKMIDSESSGVMFTINPATNKNEIIIEAGFGLGEAIVGGQITPDTYTINKENYEIKEKKISNQPWMYARDEGLRRTNKIMLSPAKAKEQKLTDDQIIRLAEIGKKIERHYNKPQDIEYAIEHGRIYIVQTRSVTTEDKVKKARIHDEIKATPILNGLGASPGIGSGIVKIVQNINDLNKIQKGDILVTVMTNPDFVVAMQKASAILTDEGGITSHAAIVSREMGIPCVVGSENATKILKDNDTITVDGTNGKVYKGKPELEEAKKEKIEYPFRETKTKIYMNLGEPDKIDEYKELFFDGIGLMRLEFVIANKIGEHPNMLIRTGQQNEYINGLCEGIKKVASNIDGKPIIVRFSDFKTNEYKNLKGGEEFEPHEDNPMIGWRGVSRYVSEEFKEAFKLECAAIKKVREEYKNVYVMLPFVRTVDEVTKCLAIMKDCGLERNEDFKIFLMAEVPSMALIPEEFAELDIDGVSIGSNDLTQLCLGVDRDSAKLGRMHYFDERNHAVLKAIHNIINGFKEKGKTVSICGQAPSEYKEIVEFLVKEGITSISVNPDVVNKTRFDVYDVEGGVQNV